MIYIDYMAKIDIYIKINATFDTNINYSTKLWDLL